MSRLAAQICCDLKNWSRNILCFYGTRPVIQFCLISPWYSISNNTTRSEVGGDSDWGIVSFRSYVRAVWSPGGIRVKIRGEVFPFSLVPCVAQRFLLSPCGIAVRSRENRREFEVTLTWDPSESNVKSTWGMKSNWEQRETEVKSKWARSEIDVKY